MVNEIKNNTELNSTLQLNNENYYNKIKYNLTNHNVIMNQQNCVPFLTFPSLLKIPFIRHGFSTKIGGVSEGHLSSMNLSFHRGDKRENVIANYNRICDALLLNKDHLVFSDQVHETNIHVVTKEDRGKGIVKSSDITEIDGLITNCSDTPLVTFYADCVPLFFVDTEKKAIGLTHSGWRGTVKKIGLKTLEAMKETFGTDPSKVVAVIGPSICAKCYEVSKDVAYEFQKSFTLDEIKDILIEKENGKYQLDLWLANKYILLEAGIKEENLTISTVCTCCNDTIFYSHRATNGMRGNLAAFLSII